MIGHEYSPRDKWEAAVDPARCRKAIFSNYHHSQCGQRAKYPADAPQWCGRHNPEAVAAREARRNAKWDAKWEAQKAAYREALVAKERESTRLQMVDRLEVAVQEAIDSLRQLAVAYEGERVTAADFRQVADELQAALDGEAK